MLNANSSHNQPDDMQKLPNQNPDIYIYIYICVCVCVYIYNYIYLCACVFTYVCFNYGTFINIFKSCYN